MDWNFEDVDNIFRQARDQQNTIRQAPTQCARNSQGNHHMIFEINFWVVDYAVV